MELGSKLILFLLLITVSCNDIDTVELIPESPIAYEQCDKMCKKKFGERSSVYAVQKSHVFLNELKCLCR